MRTEIDLNESEIDLEMPAWSEIDQNKCEHFLITNLAIYILSLIQVFVIYSKLFQKMRNKYCFLPKGLMPCRVTRRYSISIDEYG